MMRLDETNTLALTPCLYLNSIKSYRQKTYVDLVTSSYDLIWPSQGLFLQNWHCFSHWYPHLSCFWTSWSDLTRFRGRWFFSHCLIMGMSRKWPDLRSPIWKIRDIQLVGVYVLIKSCKIQVIRSTTVSWVWWQSSKNLVWGHLMWPESVTFSPKSIKIFRGPV